MTLAILIGASLFRLWLWWTEGKKWSAADETVMCRLGIAAAAPGYSYRRACHEWLEHPEASKWPGVVRFGNIFLLGAAFRISKRNSYYVASALSTAASIATLWLSWLLVPDGTVWAALAISFSALQLHLGRRALQDQTICALTLGALLAGLSGQLLLAAVLAAALIAFKETTALHTLALGAAWVANGSGPVAVVAAIAGSWALYFAAFCAITREPLLLWKLGRRLTEARHDSYGIEHQQGALHRLPVDLFLLAPAAVVLALRTTDLTPLVVFAVALLAVQSAVPILRSVRMVTAADAAVHVVAASFVSPVLACAVAAADLYIFWRVFQRRAVYDPITLNLVTALGFAPKRD